MNIVQAKNKKIKFCYKVCYIHSIYSYLNLKLFFFCLHLKCLLFFFLDVDLVLKKNNKEKETLLNRAQKKKKK